MYKCASSKLLAAAGDDMWVGAISAWRELPPGAVAI